MSNYSQGSAGTFGFFGTGTQGNGAGGNSLFPGAQATTTPSNGITAAGNGGGGGGAYNLIAGTARTGGSGAPGIIIIQEYYN